MNAIRRIGLLLTLFLGLAACGTGESIWAPDEDVQRAAYVHAGPPSLTLITVVSNNTGAGGHTGLLINGSQRVVWDPAGSWWNPGSPERNDLHYGIHDPMLENYVDYHARETFHVVLQEVPVTAAVAEQAIIAAKNYGAVPRSLCARSTSEIITRLPGFTHLGVTYAPKRLMAQFDRMPGVKKDVIYDDSPDDNTNLLPNL